jgi:hypothetical protein
MSTDPLIPMEDSTISSIMSDIEKHLPKVPKKKLTKEEIAAKANLNVPNEYKDRYVNILYKHQFLSDAHQKFCHHCSTSVETHLQRFRLKGWPPF